MKKNGITLIGMPYSGKSTIGKLLADNLSFEFLDLDLLIENTVSRAPQEYIETEGERKFLDLEERLALAQDLSTKIFSPGGSIIYSKKAMDKIKRETVVVYLNIPLENLRKRITNLETRGIIGLDRLGFDNLFHERSPLYEKCADLVISINNEDEIEIKQKILELLKQAAPI